MNVKALAIFIGKVRVGVMFQYSVSDQHDVEGANVISRFVVDEQFIMMSDAPLVSASYLAGSADKQAAFWRDVKAPSFNGRFSSRNGWLLPPFFQNLLPEGVFRDHVAELRGCSPTDHFEMLAACGKDLPGNIQALPVELSGNELARYVTQQQDALEMSVTAAPLDEGVSLSGVQPKVAVTKQGERYVGRTRDSDTHIIAKLPVVGQARLPELEHLSLRLASAAGVNACLSWLEPLAKLAVQHGYDLGDADQSTQFLVVPRYDRSPEGRQHCEDFAQVLGEMPEDKYGGLKARTAPQTYLNIAAVLLSFASLGEAAVHELLRRLVVNEMLGNPDMHLKNIGLRYADATTPELPPAYDVVAYAAFNRILGHALMILPPALLPKAETGAKQMLSPAMLRAFCAALKIPEKPAAKVIADCVTKASESWPSLIAQSAITDQQKERLLAHFQTHTMVASLARRRQRGA